MFIETSIELDGINSEDMGIINCQVESGMLEVPFGVNQSIIEERINNTYYLNRVDQEPLVFNVTLALDEDKVYDYETRKKLVNWLFQKTYKPFRSMDNPQIVYYVIAVGSAKRFDNYRNQGYINMQFRCDSPYGYSYPISIDTYDLSDNTTSQIITIDNLSNVDEYYFPEVEFQLQGNSTGITIQNLTDEGKIFEFTGLNLGESIYVDNKMKRIISSLGDNTYRLSEFNKGWLRLLQGENRLKITGKCILQIKAQYPISL